MRFSQIAKKIKPLAESRYSVIIASTVSGLALCTGFLLLILGPIAWLVGGNSVRHLQGFNQATAINAVRQTLLTAFGGAAALVALGFTVRTFYLSRRGQVTDRFNKAIGQLASDKLEERLGGIFALEHIMAESPRDHVAVIGILCAFVRTRTLIPGPVQVSTTRQEPINNDPPPFGTEPAPDIDNAMIVIARRPRREEPNRPDLRRTNLVGLSLRIFDFTKPPRLDHMFLTAADLRSADLRGADLSRTIFTEADLRWAWLSGANLSRTGLGRVQLYGAHMANANLAGALLEDVDLRDVDGLTPQQLSYAMIDKKTLLPSDLADDPWVKARLADCAALPDNAGPWACPKPTPKPADLGETTS